MRQTKDISIASSQALKEKQYWLDKLAGEIVKTGLPLDSSIGANDADAAESVAFTINDTLQQRLLQVSKGLDPLLHMIFTAGVTLLLHKYSGNQDIITGTSIDRQQGEGTPINTILPLRYTIDPATPFKLFLKQIRQGINEAIEHQNFPIEVLLYDNLGFQEDEGFPLFDVAVVLENIQEKSYLQHLNCPVLFLFEKRDNAIAMAIEYNNRLYSRESIDRFGRHLLIVLEQAFQNTESPISELSLMTGEEKQRIMEQFNNTDASIPEQPYHECFSNQARQTPDALAIRFMDQTISYRELDETSNQWANWLLDQGLEPEQPVAVILDRSIVMAQAILGIWKAGCHYIPIDPQYPSQRKDAILQNAGVKTVITAQETTGWQQASKQAPAVPTSIHDLAYIIFTSGSTGTPKGAMVEHLGMMNHLLAKIEDLDINEHSVVAQNASHTFDISVWQFFSALLRGGATVVYPNDLVLETPRFIQQVEHDGITILEVVPSYLTVVLDTLADSPASFPTLRYLMVTGEAVKPDLVNQWLALYPNVPVVNAYGPTEASDDITHHFMRSPVAGVDVPLGKPLRNMKIYVVDAEMNLCPVGVTGEIVVSGIAVGRGYVNDKQRTAAVFTTDPFRPEANARLYKTGDLGRFLDDGTLEFKGRKDYQVKIRGFRIELGEIEHVLSSHPQVKEAIVVDRTDSAGRTYLCAYTVLEQPVAAQEMKDFLGEMLPAYMVPAFIVPMEKLPLTANGKVDRKALPEPDTGGDNGIPFISAELLNQLKEAGPRPSTELTTADQERFMGNIAQSIAQEREVIEAQTKITGIPHFPLSHPQKMIYLTEKKYPGTASENLIYYITYNERLDRAVLQEAVNLLLRQTDSLRSRFVEIEGENGIVPAQYVAEQQETTIEEKDFSGPGGEQEFEQWLLERNTEPLPYIDTPLHYFAYLTLSDGRSGYYMRVHHGVSDGWTTFLLAQEIHRLYNELKGGSQPAPKQLFQYKDYIMEEIDYLHSAQARQDMAFWHKQLHPLPEEVKLWNSEGDPSDVGGLVATLPVPVELRTALHNYRDANKSSLFKLFLAGLALYTREETGIGDFVIGTLNHNRSTPQFWQTPGTFISFVPLRVVIDPGQTFDTFVQELGGDVNHVMKHHQRYPFDFLVNEIREQTGVDPGYFFNINLIGHPDVPDTGFDIRHQFPGYEPTPLSIHINFSNMDLQGILELEYDYQADLFTEEEIGRMHRRLCNILTMALDAPEQHIGQLFPAAEINSPGNLHLHGRWYDAAALAESLEDYPGIEQAVVVRREDCGHKHLNGCLKAGKGIDETALMNHLKSRCNGDLPRIRFFQLEEIPLLEDGTPHLQILEALDPSLQGKVSLPTDATEKKLAAIWAEVVGVKLETIGRHSNFFEIGGHSLSATIMASRIHRAFHVRIPLVDIFKSPTLSELAGAIKNSGAEAFANIQPAAPAEHYPLSPAQTRLFVLQQMEKDTVNYNLPLAVTLTGDLDIANLESALNDLIARHESFRTSFHILDDEAVQKIHENVHITLERMEADESQIKQIILDFPRPFDLETPPLIRTKLLRIAADHHVLIIDMHHIVTDGVTYEILVRDFMRLLKGEALPPLKLQYKDYAVWQHSPQQQEKIAKEKNFWMNEFTEGVPVLDLPTDHPRPAVRSSEGGRYKFKIEGNPVLKLRELATKNEATMYMLLLSAYNVFLAKICNQEDIVVGTPSVGRNHADLEGIAGVFTNTLALRNFPRARVPFSGLLREVSQRAMQAFGNQTFQFDSLVEALNPERIPGRNPMFDAMFVFQRFGPPAIDIPNLKLNLFEYQNKTSKFDLILHSTLADDRLLFTFEYYSKLFKESTIQRFAGYFERIVEQIVENPHQKIADIEILSVKTGAAAGKPKDVSFNF